MKRLILHIGTHKTGSSAIQAWLSESRDALRQQGVWYGATDRAPHPALPKHTSLYSALANPKRDLEAEKKAILEDFERSGCETLILSEEGLSEPYYRPLARIAELSRTFETEVICFLRRQDHFLESLWNQRSRERIEKRPIEDFVLSEHSRLITGYIRKLDFWSRIGSVRTIAYDESKGSSVAAFANAAGLSFDDRELAENPSPSMNCAVVCNLLNRRGIRYDPWKLVYLFRHDRRRSALGRRLRSRILADHADRNAYLARNFGVEFDSSVPDEPEDPLNWPERRALVRAMIGLFMPR